MIEAQVEIADFPMVESLVLSMREDGDLTTDRAIATIKEDFDRLGPYHFAKREGLLMNGSGEEFACQFMSFYNDFVGHQVY